MEVKKRNRGQTLACTRSNEGVRDRTTRLCGNLLHIRLCRDVVHNGTQLKTPAIVHVGVVAPAKIFFHGQRVNAVHG